MYGSKKRATSRRIASRGIDRGPKPRIIGIEKETTSNKTYRTAIWTGAHLQVTLMSINVGDDVGLERHADTDQFLRIEEGEALVQVGKTRSQLGFLPTHAKSGDAILIPAGTWHNVINVGTKPLKLYSVYAPPHHPSGTIESFKPRSVKTPSRTSSRSPLSPKRLGTGKSPVGKLKRVQSRNVSKK